MKRTASVVVELIAILFMVGLVAVVAIPDHTPVKPRSQHQALISALEQVRTALGRYWGDHDALYPTLDDAKNLADPTAPPRSRTDFSDYLISMPENPFTGGRSVAPIDTLVGESDWAYDPQTGVFKANNSVDHRAL